MIVLDNQSSWLADRGVGHTRAAGPMRRVTYDDLLAALLRAVRQTGMEPTRASRCAKMFADATLDGVASHGVNRFPPFIARIRKGDIDVHAQAERVEAHGAVERWDGHRGPGNLNASDCMDAAIALSRAHGIGCVGLANTNHWMRGGTYGWQAADSGAIAICWTNTFANLAPWGASTPRIGNNPLVIAIPRPPAHVILDMAMSQFSFGVLASYRRNGEQLPVPGGYDPNGDMTRDPALIEATGRVVPAGFWKGSGLALMLDLLAAALSGGRATCQVPDRPDTETAISQVFIAFDPIVAHGTAAIAELAEMVLRHLEPEPAEGVRYPGQRTIETRRQNLAEGIPVYDDVWEAVQQLGTD